MRYGRNTNPRGLAGLMSVIGQGCEKRSHEIGRRAHERMLNTGETLAEAYEAIFNSDLDKLDRSFNRTSR